jgi:hypothetical protein
MRVHPQPYIPNWWVEIFNLANSTLHK